MRLTELVTLNFNNNMPTDAVFLDTGKAFDKTWHLGLLYKLLVLKFSISLIKLISSFLSQRKFGVSIEGELSTQRVIQAGVPQGSILSPLLYSLYINDTPQTPGRYIGLFADNTCIYATDCKEGYVLRKLQKGFIATETWHEHWDIKMNGDKTQAIYFAHRLRLHKVHLTHNGQNIHFVNYVKYLSVIFDKRITWRLHLEMIEAKALRTFVRIYSLWKSEPLSTNIKQTLHKSLIRSVITYACRPAWELAVDTYLVKLQRLQNKALCTIGNFPRCRPVCNLHTVFNLPYVYDYITKLCRKQAEVIWTHENEHVRGIGQGEARHRKYES
jgi:hypothetical protein